MMRFLAGVLSALLMVSAGIFIWRAQADRPPLIPAAPSATAAQAPLGMADLAPPPQADERTREEKRFNRYDRDKNGAVARSEYLANRQKSFARIDLDHDGRLSFDEYAAKAVTKFAAADRDRNGALNATEFVATRVVRKAKPTRNCPPAIRAPQAPDEEG